MGTGGQMGQVDRWDRWTDVNGWTDRRDGQMRQISTCEQMDRQKRWTDEKSSKD